MTLRKWGYLFWTTLGWGSLTALVVGLVLINAYDEFTNLFMEVSQVGFNKETMLLLLFIVLGGATISVLSQAGFFAYLILRYLATGIFRKRRMWELVQIVLIVVAFVDLAYLRYASFAEEGSSYWSYLLYPSILLVIAFIVSLWKKKQTNQYAFVPTLFFMYVITMLEAVPSFKMNLISADIFMLSILIVSNAWQILLLHKIVGNEKASQ